MFAFLIRRVVQAVVVMLIISCIGFALKHSFGDPVRDLVGVSVSKAERDKITEKLGLNDPVMVQYGRFLKGVLHGDVGQSFFFKKPALEVIVSHAPATLELVFAASLIIVVFSIPAGVYAAIRPRSLLSRCVMSLSTLGVSVPVFFTAIMMIYVFSVELNWMPSFGRGETVELFGFWDSGLLTLDGLKHLVMPAIALSSIMLPLFIRLIQAEMMEVLQSEYVKFAFAKGLAPFRVYMIHAFKNTLLPVITVGGVQLGTMIAFTILTETVFNWRGMGAMFVEAVERSDTSLLVAYLVVVGLIFIVVNTAVDVVYGLVNPMVRVAGRK